MQEWTEEILEPNKTLVSFFFTLCMFKIYVRVRKQFLQLSIVEFEFFDIFYSKFQLMSTFYIWSKFLCWKLTFFAVT